MYSFASTQYNAPGSSPGSSPDVGPIDSSPCSSPGFEPLDLDDDIPIIHPFAGAFRPMGPKRAGKSPDFATSDAPLLKKARYVAKMEPEEPSEDDIWAGQAEQAFEGRRIFILDNHNFTRIDTRFITDLGIVVDVPQLADPGAPPAAPKPRDFDRTVTISALPRQFSRQFSRSDSFKNSVPAGEDGNIHLYLANNFIARIPRELFALRNLVTLTLRNNKLRYLPPEIALLTHLRDLNVATNQLSFLPCELGQLSLKTLHVHPNPFMEKPDAVVEDTSTVPVFPTLFEIACRILMSPPTSSIIEKYDTEGQAPRPSLLEYFLPLPSDRVYGPKVVETLNRCHPNCIAAQRRGSQKEEEEDKSNGVGKCPNPLHPKPSYYTEPMEQRFTWEARIGGQVVGGAVPVRWRGCCSGCLSFLDKPQVNDAETTDKVEVVEFEPVALGGDLGFDDE